MSGSPSAPERGNTDLLNLDGPVRNFVLAKPAAARVFESLDNILFPSSVDLESNFA